MRLLGLGVERQATRANADHASSARWGRILSTTCALFVRSLRCCCLGVLGMQSPIGRIFFLSGVYYRLTPPFPPSPRPTPETGSASCFFSSARSKDAAQVKTCWYFLTSNSTVSRVRSWTSIYWQYSLYWLRECQYSQYFAISRTSHITLPEPCGNPFKLYRIRGERL